MTARKPKKLETVEGMLRKLARHNAWLHVGFNTNSDPNARWEIDGSQTGLPVWGRTLRAALESALRAAEDGR